MKARTVGWTIASVAALGTLVGGVAAACSAADGDGGGGNSAVAQGSGNNAGNVDGDNGGCVNVGGNCIIEPKPVDTTDPDKAIEQEIHRDAPPDGKGPWPFTVLYEDGQGLF